MDSGHKTKRVYREFDPKLGYPSGRNLFYECLKCAGVVPALPQGNTRCNCGNISIDLEYARMSIIDHSQIRLCALGEE